MQVESIKWYDCYCDSITCYNTQKHLASIYKYDQKLASNNVVFTFGKCRLQPKQNQEALRVFEDVVKIAFAKKLKKTPSWFLIEPNHNRIGLDIGRSLSWDPNWQFPKIDSMCFLCAWRQHLFNVTWHKLQSSAFVNGMNVMQPCQNESAGAIYVQINFCMRIIHKWQLSNFEHVEMSPKIRLPNKFILHIINTQLPLNNDY